MPIPLRFVGECEGATVSARRQFAETQLGAYRHVCGFFDGPEDKYRATLPFVDDGLEQEELAFHTVDSAKRHSYTRRLEQAGILVAQSEKNGQFELRAWPETYLRDGKFDPDAMLARVEEVLQDGKKLFPLLRIVGQMNSTDAPRKTWDDWVSYEARLNGVVSKHPDVVICVYETCKCDGRMVMDLLRAHPAVIIGGSIRSNPFFVPTDEFLAGLRDRAASRAESASDPADGHQTLDPVKSNMELYERVLAVAGHDLGNPLGAVIMGASVLKREPGKSAQVVDIASRILGSAQRMKRMVRDLFDLGSARLSGGMDVKPAPIDAHKLCGRIVEELQMGNPGREIRFRGEGDGNGSWDAGRLEQVVSNLTANALYYSPDDAPVTVESRGSDMDWTLSVQNRGEAIPPEVLSRPFEPFRRGPNGGSAAVPHLGIGLFIVRRIVEAHRGTVEVTSSPTEGTVFVVRLPKS